MSVTHIVSIISSIHTKSDADQFGNRIDTTRTTKREREREREKRNTTMFQSLWKDGKLTRGGNDLVQVREARERNSHCEDRA